MMWGFDRGVCGAEDRTVCEMRRVDCVCACVRGSAQR